MIIGNWVLALRLVGCGLVIHNPLSDGYDCIYLCSSSFLAYHTYCIVLGLVNNTTAGSTLCLFLTSKYLTNTFLSINSHLIIFIIFHSQTIENNLTKSEYR